jgi:hypothetical protein
VARGRLGLLLAGGLLRVRFGEVGLLVRLRRRSLVRPVGRVVGRPFRGRLRYLCRRLWVARVGFVIVVATGFGSVVVAVLAAAVIATLLATAIVSEQVQQQEQLLAARAALVRAAVWVVQTVAVLALRSTMRRWWSAR